MLGFSGCGRFIMLVFNSPENPIITALSWIRAWAQLSLPGAGGTPALPSHPNELYETGTMLARCLTSWKGANVRAFSFSGLG